MILEFFVILAGLIGSAFFSGIETGIISIHRMRLEHRVRMGAKGTDKLQAYLDNPPRLLGTTLVGNNICNVVVSILAASVAVRLIGEWGEAVSSAVITLAILLGGEYIPKSWFLGNPLDRCSRFVGVLRLSELVLLPVSKTVIWLTSWLVPATTGTLTKPGPFLTRDDLKLFAREGEEGGELSPKERMMIHRVIELSHKRAHEIMIPRKDMTVVEGLITLTDFFEIARHSGFTRLPVYDKEADKFTGIVNVFSALPVPPSDHTKPVAEFAKAPLFIDADMPVDDILPRLRHSRQPMCLVTNAAGAVVGLLTTEDILEEIVGTLE